MGRESALWGHFKAAVEKTVPKEARHLVRVENTLSDGHPDVNLCIYGKAGDLELKQRRAWPVRPSTLVRLPHYTDVQRRWLGTRHLAGGRVFLLLQIDDDYLLFRGAKVLPVGRVDKAGLLDLAAATWHLSLKGDDLVKELTK